MAQMTWHSGCGVEIADLDEAHGFAQRGAPLDSRTEDDALVRLRSAISESVEVALNELVRMAVEYCHADSSGISLEEDGPNGKTHFRWIAVAGSFTRYLNGTTPRFYSPCGTCLDRGVPQRYQVWEPYYNFLGVNADPILDGLLIPWHAGDRQGTLWIVSHRAKDTFTESDFSFMRKLANFVSIGIGNKYTQVGH